MLTLWTWKLAVIAATAAVASAAAAAASDHLLAGAPGFGADGPGLMRSEQHAKQQEVQRHHSLQVVPTGGLIEQAGRLALNASQDATDLPDLLAWPAPADWSGFNGRDYDSTDPCLDVEGGGWILVRHTAARIGWGPWDDDLQGLAPAFGNQAGPAALHHWTIPWAAVEAEHFLIATADCAFWLVATPAEVIGEEYASATRHVLASSGRDGPCGMRWYNRGHRHREDPVILMDNITTDILYAEHSSEVLSDFKDAHGGSNVYIRSRSRNWDTSSIL